jgi:hypothetical protein
MLKLGLLREVIGKIVQSKTPLIIMAKWNFSNSSVGSSKGEKVSHLEVGTLFDHIPRNKRSLREPNKVKLLSIVKVGIFSERITSFLCVLREVIENRGIPSTNSVVEISINFNAFGVHSRDLRDVSCEEFSVGLALAVRVESVEKHCWSFYFCARLVKESS